MAIGCEPSAICCNIDIPFGAAYISKCPFTLGLKKASLLFVKGYVHKIGLLVISMFSEPVKPVFVNELSISVSVYVFNN